MYTDSTAIEWRLNYSMMKFQTFKTFCLIWLFWLSVRPEYNSHRFARIINNNHITQNNPLDLCLWTLGRKKKIGSRQGLANNDRAINEYWVLEQKYEQNSADLEQWLKMFVFNSNDTVSAFTLKVNMCRQRELSLFLNHCQEVFLISRKLSFFSRRHPWRLLQTHSTSTPV